MDYSLLLAIETFDIDNNLKSMHQVGARPISVMLKSQDGNVQEVEVKDVGYLMSRKHCFMNGDRVYHLAIIDFLQEWNC